MTLRSAHLGGAGEVNGWLLAEPGFLGLATPAPSAWEECPACRLPALQGAA